MNHSFITKDMFNKKITIVAVVFGVLLITLIMVVVAVNKKSNKTTKITEKRIEAISIANNLSNIPIIEDTITLPNGVNYLLSVDRIPNTVTERVILNFKSDNEEVASVNEFGLVQSHSLGEATITVVTKDDASISDQIKVIVVEPKIQIKKISLSPTNLNLDLGTTFLSVAEIEPDDATDKSLIWESSKPEIVTVDDFGNITGKSTGKTTISAISSNGVSGSCEVTVTEPEITAESVLIDNGDLELETGKIETLTTTIKPANVKNKTLIWSSSNEEIVKVDDTGKITALQPGSVKITVRTDNLKMDTITVRVIDDKVVQEISSNWISKVIYPLAISLSSSEINLMPAEKRTIKLSIEPENATNKNIILTNNFADIISITENNDEVEITAIKSGEADLEFSTINGKTAILHVKIKDNSELATGVNVSSSLVNLYVGDKQQITANIEPNTTENKTLEWISSDNHITSVDNNGLILAVNPGLADIIVKTANNKTANIKVIVNDIISSTNESVSTPTQAVVTPTTFVIDKEQEEEMADEEIMEIEIKNISLGIKNLLLNPGETKQIPVLFTPQNSSDKSLTWTSGNNKIATVDDYGTVTAKSSGQVIIKATTFSNIGASLSVTVSGPTPGPTAIVFTPTSTPTLLPTPTLTNVNRSFTTQKQGSMSYWLYLPKGYNKARKWPLVIFLHGAGEIGSDINKLVYADTLPRLIKNGTDYEAVFIAPQYRTQTYSGKSYLKFIKEDLIPHIVLKYNIDMDKVSLTGHSFGANNTAQMGHLYPNFFSCLVPVSVCSYSSSWAKNLVKENIRVFYGEKDSCADRSKNFANAVNKAGGKATVTVIPKGGHVVTTQVYVTHDAVNWMIKQVRGKPGQ